MASVSFLPKLFRWVFTVLTAVSILVSLALLLAIVIDPKLPPGVHFGPVNGEFAGQPAYFLLQPSGTDSNFTASIFRGTIELFVTQAGGLVEVAKHHGLPVLLINAVFFAILFELLRRLFRNVGLGHSFTRQTVQLVQLVGGALIVFSLVSAFAEAWFAQAVYGYLADHATLTVSGTSLHIPHLSRFAMFPRPRLNSPVFFAGLLVLALSEVFRQGLALQAEHDLTV